MPTHEDGAHKHPGESRGADPSKGNGHLNSELVEVAACAHRPAGEAERLWERDKTTWGADADPRYCTCCGGPARGTTTRLR